MALAGSCLERLLGWPDVPSIEGRNLPLASGSEKRRQLQNRAWTIRGFMYKDPRRVGVLTAVDLVATEKAKPGPDDPWPDVLAEVTLCKGSKSQRSLYFNNVYARAWDDWHSDG